MTGSVQTEKGGILLISTLIAVPCMDMVHTGFVSL